MKHLFKNFILTPFSEAYVGEQQVWHSLVPLDIYVDVNDDKVIASGERPSAGQPFDIWINDDDDEHAPQAKERADYTTTTVDGEDDVADLFPVFLDIKQLVAALPPENGASYKLKQADGALNFVQSNLFREEAFLYRQKLEEFSYGPGLDSLVWFAPTEHITPGGAALSTNFLNCIKNSKGGVILVEGRKPSNAPLVLVIEKDGATVAEIELPLSIRARIVLLLHGMNSNTATWNDFVTNSFGNLTTGAANIVDGAIQGTTAPLMTPQGVRCYRLQFGVYDQGSTREGLEYVTAANTNEGGYLADKASKRCGDFETFAELGQEVDDAIDELVDPDTHPEHQYAKFVLVGHSRGGIAARAFLQGSSSRRSSVVGLVTTGSPHQGSPMGRIYTWLDEHRRNAAGTDENDWEVVDLLLGKDFDVRRPTIGDLAVLTTFNAGVSSLPTGLRCAELVYQHENLGRLARLPESLGGFGSYTVFDESGTNPGDQLSSDAQTFILGAGHTSASFMGDGLIPGPNQRFTTLPGFGAVTVAPLRNTTASVLHIEEPLRFAELRSQLKATTPKWFP